MPFPKPLTRAFTLIELMLVIILIGLIAGFAIPNYTKAMARSKERDALGNLHTLRDAVKLYISRNNETVPPNLGSTSAINTALNVGIIEQQGNTYQCTATHIYTCSATNSDGWQLAFQLDTNDGEPFCNAGGCPTTP